MFRTQLRKRKENIRERGKLVAKAENLSGREKKGLLPEKFAAVNKTFIFINTNLDSEGNFVKYSIF